MNFILIFYLILVVIGVVFSVWVFNSTLFIKSERSRLGFSTIATAGLFLLALIVHSEFVRVVSAILIVSITCYMTVYISKHLKEDDRHPDENDMKLSQAIAIIELYRNEYLGLTPNQHEWLINYIHKFTEERQEHAYLVVSDILKKASSKKLNDWGHEFYFEPFKRWLDS